MNASDVHIHMLCIFLYEIKKIKNKEITPGCPWNILLNTIQNFLTSRV